MAFKTSVPISNPIWSRITTTLKNVPTHLHIGLFGSKTSNLPVTRVGNGMFPTKGGSLPSR